MIRILHVLHSMDRGGAENALMNYYRHIDRTELQFDFLLTTSQKSQFEEEILEMGGIIYHIPVMTKRNPFRYLFALDNFFKKHKEYEIVHSHTSSKSVFPLYFAKKHGIKVRIAHSHNTKSESGLNGVIRDFLKKPLIKVANYYFACGNEAGRWLYGNKLFESGKVKVVPNVIDSKLFLFNREIRHKMREKLNVPEDTIIVGCTARFSKQKNHCFLLDVFAAFRETFHNSKLLLIGDGELKNSIIEKSQRLNVFNDIIFTGVVPNVADYEQAMDLFLMTSLYEGLPLSVVEAQISGLPCIVGESVTKEVDLTGLVSFLPINHEIDMWVKEMNEQLGKVRTGYLPSIIKAGYDAETSAKDLQSFYLSSLKLK